MLCFLFSPLQNKLLSFGQKPIPSCKTPPLKTTDNGTSIDKELVLKARVIKKHLASHGLGSRNFICLAVVVRISVVIVYADHNATVIC